MPWLTVHIAMANDPVSRLCIWLMDRKDRLVADPVQMGLAGYHHADPAGCLFCQAGGCISGSDPSIFGEHVLNNFLHDGLCLCCDYSFIAAGRDYFIFSDDGQNSNMDISLAQSSWQGWLF